MEISIKLLDIIFSGLKYALDAKHEFVTPEHLLKAALDSEEVKQLIDECNGNLQDIQKNTESYLSKNVFALENVEPVPIEEAILLSEFANEENYWEKEHKLNKDKYFFSTVDNIERTIGFKIDKQRKLIKSLEKKNIINVQYRDLPRKRYIRINDKKIFELL